MSRIVVVISGRGSNMRALVEAGLPVVAVLANRADAAGLAFARERGIATSVVEHRSYATRDAFDAALAAQIDAHAPTLVVLAGFMRVLTAEFVDRYTGRLVNIHPSLLPAFPGLHTHERALQAGVRIHGATVHFVTSDLDQGPIIAQAAVPVLPGDTPDTLAARVLEQEHVIFPRALRWIVEGKVMIADRRVRIAGEPAQWSFAP